MAIPEELRDRIIEFVLLSSRPSPAIVTYAARSGTKRAKRDYNVSCEYGFKNVLYEESTIISNSYALLLPNRHTHNQSQEALTRLFPYGITYKLDVTQMNEKQLWPTWLSVPTYSKHVTDVDASIRISGTSKFENSGFARGNGGLLDIVWCYYWLLEHFLKYGIGPASQRKRHDLSVTTITLSFVSDKNDDHMPEDTEEHEQRWWERQYYYQRNAGYRDMDLELLAANNSLHMHPRWLASFIAKQIESLVHMDYHQSEHGALIHERIANIRILSQGQLVKQINPGALLAGKVVQPDDGSKWYTTRTFGLLGGDCRLLTFWNWKYRTICQRHELGLLVGEPVIWPDLVDIKQWRIARDEYRRTSKYAQRRLGCNDRCMCSDRALEQMLERGEAEYQPK